MGGARRAFMRNFRGKYDIINTIAVFASSLVVGTGSVGFLFTERKTVKEEEFTVHSISLVGRVVRVVASMNCSIYVPKNDRSAVA
eukprot:scaffold317964_cov15-Tisochrysis_lutea.AAC.1